MDVNKKTKLEVKFYCTSTGNEPVREWLKELPKNVKLCIGQDIKTVQYGWPIGMPLIKNMGAGIWEVRTKIPDGGIARVLFVFIDNKMVLLNGFIKKSQKTPKKELDLAIKRYKELKNDL